MNTLFVAARAVHYASALLLFGELLCVTAVAPFAWRSARPGDADALSRRFYWVARWGIAAGVASGIAWFAAEAAVMSGKAWPQALGRETLDLVLGSTLFGQVWTLRAGLVAVLAALLVAMRRAGATRRPAFALSGVLVAAAYLGSLACAGHAIAAGGSDDGLELGADFVHLLAAGAWLGSLPALVFLLGADRPCNVAAQAAQRFSRLGVASVAALTASGLVSAWYQVGGLPALIGTRYGQLLLAKLVLFTAMLGLALVNRGFLTQRVRDGDPLAQQLLRRNAMLEIALGIGVVTLVGKLGITVPAAHQTPLWPFARTLSWQPMQQSAWIQLVLAGAGMVACIAALFAVTGVLHRPPRVRIGTLAAIMVPAGLYAWLLVVPAHPTTYVSSPVGYTATAVARGAVRYAAECGRCHGVDGRGDGPEAVSLPIGPKDLAEAVPDRREGDLYWSIARGAPGTAMPALAPPLSDTDIWNLIQYLDALSAARNAVAMTDRVKPLRPIAAPEFTYELAGRAQESLTEQRGNRVTLLVFYTLPQSLPRLDEIARQQRAYRAAGARVIALPMATSKRAEADTVTDGASILASAVSDVATAYAMFAAPAEGDNAGAPEHVEYLIDRHGYLRVRWIGIPETAAGRSAAMLKAIDFLAHEPPRPPPQWGHRH